MFTVCHTCQKVNDCTLCDGVWLCEWCEEDYIDCCEPDDPDDFDDDYGPEQYEPVDESSSGQDEGGA